jgi:hypothetical protein
LLRYLAATLALSSSWPFSARLSVSNNE